MRLILFRPWGKYRWLWKPPENDNAEPVKH